MFPPDRGLYARPLVEAGAIAGSDGHGGFAGAGLTFVGHHASGSSLGVVARFVQTTEERRVDFALDLQLPFGAD